MIEWEWSGLPAVRSAGKRTAAPGRARGCCTVGGVERPPLAQQGLGGGLSWCVAEAFALRHRVDQGPVPQ